MKLNYIFQGPSQSCSKQFANIGYFYDKNKYFEEKLAKRDIFFI